MPDSSKLIGPLAVAGAGGLLLYSGIQNKGALSALRGLLHGQAPSTAAAGAPVTGTDSADGTSGGSAPAGDTGAPTATAAANQAIARLLAAPYGWSTGQQWDDLVSLWARESGWSNTAENPSGAYGIAQALGHGPTNQYPAGPANPPVSSATAQISWGLSYIAYTYGSPSAAWAHEESAGWY